MPTATLCLCCVSELRLYWCYVRQVLVVSRQDKVSQ